MANGFYELKAIYDGRGSFYGKAQIIEDDYAETLYSYNVPVVQKKDGVFQLGKDWDSSATTLRHVKEYLKQEGSPLGDMTKAQIAKAIKENPELIGDF